jgi:hypothetical protein
MVTANLNHERRPSSNVDSEDDENNNRQIQSRLVSISYFIFSIILILTREKKMSHDLQEPSKFHHSFFLKY